jgi:putative ABC transport system permease protein
MIGIITNISVLERTKEIGILRAIGASKKDISRVFNAETFIIGVTAGIIGIAFTLLLCLPVNAIIQALSGFSNINAVLPWEGAIILVIISMFLTIIAGFIPSKNASKKDPVVALRTE